MRWKTYAGVSLLALAIAAVPLAERGAGAEEQQPEVQSGDQVGAAAGYLFHAGGPVRGKRVRTQTAASAIGETATWVTIPGATIPYVVPAGTSDLFNVSFSVEGRLVNGGLDDWVRIRIVDTVNGVVTPLEPYDADQRFFSANAYATYTGTWTRRVNAGSHNLAVQIWIFDGAPAEALTALFDDWTFELVVYD